MSLLVNEIHLSIFLNILITISPANLHANYFIKTQFGEMEICVPTLEET